MHYFVNYFVKLRTNHYTLLTISPISSIFDSMRNLSYRPLWRFVKIPIAWRERCHTRWEQWLARRFTNCHLYTSRFSRFANIFLHSRQFNDKCIPVIPDDFFKNPYKHCRKNPYGLRKFSTFFRHGYQIKGFCKYYWNKAYISQSDYIKLFYKH